MAAFANNKGGYLVFGVSNSPRKLKGLQNDKFEEFDSAKISEFLNDFFSPEIAWEIAIHEVLGKKFGLLYTFECRRKPILCRKNGNGIAEGAVYFRYRARSEVIKFPELRELLEQQRERDQAIILKQIRKISEIGVRNVGLMDFQSGLVEGPGGSFIIDESLLSKVSFLKEGHFSEKASAPAIRLVGSAKAISSPLIQPTKQVIRTKALGGQEIISSFLESRSVDSPLEYVKQICFESSANYPIYYFLAQSRMTTDELVKEVEEVITTNQSKYRLIKRIKSSSSYVYPLKDSKTVSSKERKKYFDQIIQKAVGIPQSIKEQIYFLQAIRALKKEEMDLTFLNPLLRKFFVAHYGKSPGHVSDEFRRAICHIDYSCFYSSVLSGQIA